MFKINKNRTLIIDERTIIKQFIVATGFAQTV